MKEIQENRLGFFSPPGDDARNTGVFENADDGGECENSFNFARREVLIPYMILGRNPWAFRIGFDHIGACAHAVSTLF